MTNENITTFHACTVDETAGGAAVETTGAVERVAAAITETFGEQFDAATIAHDALVGMFGGEPNESGMTDVTAAIHRAVCDDSPDECIAEHGRCLLATAYLHDALLLGGAA